MTCRDCNRRTRPDSPWCDAHLRAALAAAFGRTVRTTRGAGDTTPGFPPARDVSPPPPVARSVEDRAAG